MSDEENVIPLFGGDVSKLQDHPESIFNYAMKDIRRLVDEGEIPPGLAMHFEAALRLVRLECHREAKNSLVRCVKILNRDYVKRLMNLASEEF